VEALEIARTVSLVVFDKTGTLTEGRPRVAAVVGAGGIGEREVLALAAAVNAGSTHRSPRQCATPPPGRQLPFRLRPATRSSPAAARWRCPVRRGRGGTAARQPRWIGGLGADLGALANAAGEQERAGRTVSWLARRQGGQAEAIGLIAYADTLRPGARAAIDDLRRLASRRR